MKNQNERTGVLHFTEFRSRVAIDAFCIDNSNRRIFLVQLKWFDRYKFDSDVSNGVGDVFAPIWDAVRQRPEERERERSVDRRSSEDSGSESKHEGKSSFRSVCSLGVYSFPDWSSWSMNGNVCILWIGTLGLTDAKGINEEVVDDLLTYWKRNRPSDDDLWHEMTRLNCLIEIDTSRSSLYFLSFLSLLSLSLSPPLSLFRKLIMQSKRDDDVHLMWKYHVSECYFLSLSSYLFERTSVFVKWFD